MSTLQERITAVETRLQDGFERIGAAMERGQTVDHWERVWIGLLREYEALSDELAVAKPEQAELSLGVRREAA